MVLENGIFVEVANAPFNPTKISADKYLNLFIIDDFGKLFNCIEDFWFEVATDILDVGADSFSSAGTEATYSIWTLNSYGQPVQRTFNTIRRVYFMGTYSNTSVDLTDENGVSGGASYLGNPIRQTDGYSIDDATDLKYQTCYKSKSEASEAHKWVGQISNSNYMGCFVDTWVRDLDTYLGYVQRVQECENLAINGSWLYFAVQNGKYCFASKTPPTYAKKPDSECNKPCRQNTSGILCGGGSRNSVYSMNSIPTK